MLEVFVKYQSTLRKDPYQAIQIADKIIKSADEIKTRLLTPVAIYEKSN